jgi:hypothetical protein
LEEIMEAQKAIDPEAKIPLVLEVLAKAVLDLQGHQTEGTETRFFFLVWEIFPLVLEVLAKAVLDLQGHRTEGTEVFIFLLGPCLDGFFWQENSGGLDGAS